MKPDDPLANFVLMHTVPDTLAVRTLWVERSGHKTLEEARSERDFQKRVDDAREPLHGWSRRKFKVVGVVRG